MFRHSGEEKAWLYLQERGHRLLEHNYRTPDRRTEVDLITLKDNVVHFIEVKDWKSGIPALTQNRKRQAMLRRAAVIYMGSERFYNTIMSIKTELPPISGTGGDGSVMIDADMVRRMSTLKCNNGDELCLTISASPLDTGGYSVSFDLISIINGQLEHIERLF